MWTEALQEKGPLLLMLDFDGTLVPIADHPDAIVVSAEVPRLLEGLTRAGHVVWIVTGRRAAYVQDRIGADVPVVGLHGLDWPGATSPSRHGKLDDVRARAEQAIANDPLLKGALVEDKGLSLALHYRGVDKAQQEAARDVLVALVHDVIGPDTALNVLRGHCVVELRPREASKGNAVRRLVQEHSSLVPFYVGDDVTDEEAFAALGPRGIGVRVAEGDVNTRASIVVRDVDEVLEGLATLV